MKELADITACVVDRGTFYPVAERLARDVKKVYYHNPVREAFEHFAKGCLGDGHDDVELLVDFWIIKEQIDLFVFPDCADAGLQLELASQGFPVWGSKTASSLETMRGRWLELCETLGFKMPKTHRIQGLTNLRIFLRENEGTEFFVKISRWRGDMETWSTSSPERTENKLDNLALRFGRFKDGLMFYVQEATDAEIEGGADTFNVHGQWPDKIILGYEKKGESYLATWKHREEMPDEIWKITEAIGPTLGEHQYANFVSSEVRFNDDASYWLDPCLRSPSPAGEEQLELYANFSEIVWNGANGILVQPEMTGKFCGEAVISYCGDKEGWKSLRVPEESKRWVKLYANVQHEDGSVDFPPEQDMEAIGCAVAIADTPKEVIDQLKEIAESMSDQPVELHITEIADLIEEISVAEKQGIPFSDKPMPAPEEVLEK